MMPGYERRKSWRRSDGKRPRLDSRRMGRVCLRCCSRIKVSLNLFFASLFLALRVALSVVAPGRDTLAYGYESWYTLRRRTMPSARCWSRRNEPKPQIRDARLTCQDDLRDG
jgi:hypothetical protein